MLVNLLFAEVKDNRTQPETLLERIVYQYKEEGPSKAIPHTEYILSETLDHFWAGITTTGDALAAVFYHLSHPDNKARQFKLRNQLRDAGIDAGVEVSLTKVTDVAYLDAIVRESLRHATPVAFSMSRKVTAEEGMEILGYWVPRGVSQHALKYLYTGTYKS